MFHKRTPNFSALCRKITNVITFGVHCSPFKTKRDFYLAALQSSVDMTWIKERKRGKLLLIKQILVHVWRDKNYFNYWWKCIKSPFNHTSLIISPLPDFCSVQTPIPLSASTPWTERELAFEESLPSFILIKALHFRLGNLQSLFQSRIPLTPFPSAFFAYHLSLDSSPITINIR